MFPQLLICTKLMMEVTGLCKPIIPTEGSKSWGKALTSLHSNIVRCFHHHSHHHLHHNYHALCYTACTVGPQAHPLFSKLATAQQVGTVLLFCPFFGWTKLTLRATLASRTFFSGQFSLVHRAWGGVEWGCGGHGAFSASVKYL